MIIQLHLFRLIIFFGLIFSFSSCLKDKALPPSISTYTCEDSVSYSNEIVTQIIDQSCNFAGCHNTGTNAGGYSFTNYEEVALHSEIIYKAINHEDEYVAMPLGGARIADSLVKKMYCWIEQGKLDN